MKKLTHLIPRARVKVEQVGPVAIRVSEISKRRVQKAFDNMIESADPHSPWLSDFTEELIAEEYSKAKKRGFESLWERYVRVCQHLAHLLARGDKE